MVEGNTSLGNRRRVRLQKLERSKFGAEIGVLSTYNYTSLSDNQLKIENKKPDTVFYLSFLLNEAIDDGKRVRHETFRPIWDEVDNGIIDRVRTHNTTGLSTPAATYREARPKIETWIVPIKNDGTPQVRHGPYYSVSGKRGSCGKGPEKLNGRDAETFVSATKKRFCAKFYANPGSFIGSEPSEEALFTKNNKWVVVKFSRAFTLDDFK